MAKDQASCLHFTRLRKPLGVGPHIAQERYRIQISPELLTGIEAIRIQKLEWLQVFHFLWGNVIVFPVQLKITVAM